MYDVGSLFSGVGGIELGLERTGKFRTQWFCEPTEYAAQILEQRWPGTPNHGWTTDVPDFGRLADVDVLTGGFPCQPVSMAGSRKAQEDERWMWPEYFRAIREVQPRVALIENVRGLLSKGLDDVLRDLASIGYAAEWQVIPAVALGAPHRRERVFIVAYPDDCGCVDGQARVFTAEAWEHAQRRIITGREDVADSFEERCDSRCDHRGERQVLQDKERNASQNQSERDGWKRGACSSREATKDESEDVGDSDRWYVQAHKTRGDEEGVHGQHVSERRAARPRGMGRGWWAAEPRLGRVADGIPNRVDRIKALGNAVVPQVAEAVGRAIIRSGVLDR